MKIKFDGFDWDDGNREKCKKHGVSVIEIERFFSQNSVFVAPDIDHSSIEDRYLAVGRYGNERPIFVVFTLRTKEEHVLLRPISARYMHQKEIEKYEKDIKNRLG